MRYWLVGSYLVIKITPRVPVDRPLMAIGYKYNSSKVLGFIATEIYGSTEPGYPYSSCFHDIYSNVSVRPIVYLHLLVMYFNAFNEIDNINRIQQSDLALEKYWLTQGGDFWIATTLALGMGITYGKLLVCHIILEGNVDKKFKLESKTEGLFITASMIPFQLIVITQI